jgi:hypothetical protein
MNISAKELIPASNQIMTDQEIQALQRSTSKFELLAKTASIRATILRTFSDKNPCRIVELSELAELEAELSKPLPEFSSSDFRRIEDEVASSPNRDSLDASIAKYQSLGVAIQDLRAAVARGKSRWNDKMLKRGQAKEERIKLIEIEELRRIEARRQREQEAIDRKEEEREFNELLSEVKALGFTHSNQVSAYIVRHKLGYKYKHISGVLQMESAGDTWNFNGGFPPHVYARLCKSLGLRKNCSDARPASFTAYKDILS